MLGRKASKDCYMVFDGWIHEVSQKYPPLITAMLRLGVLILNIPRAFTVPSILQTGSQSRPGRRRTSYHYRMTNGRLTPVTQLRWGGTMHPSRGLCKIALGDKCPITGPIHEPNVNRAGARCQLHDIIINRIR